MTRSALRRVAARAGFLAFAAVAVEAAVPPPANDSPAGAQVLVGLPAIATGSNVNGDDTISATTLPGLASVPGPDVFYSFTPSATGSYWIVMVPWDQIPVYASSGGTVPLPNLCVYVRRASDGVFIAGAEAAPRDQSETVVATLTAGVEYQIVVDSAEVVPRGQVFEFTLAVTAAPSGARESCVAFGSAPFAFPTAVVGTLTGAVDDLSFVEGVGRSDVAITPLAAAPDHVYEFTTGPDPNAAGDYVFNLIPGGNGWDGYVYIVDSCPPFFPLGCLGAANHTTFTQRQAEAITVTLDYDTTYYIVVDAGTAFLPNGRYVLLIDQAANYDITEVEVNNTPGLANPIVGRAGGQLTGPGDVDYWSLAVAGGEKLYAFVDNGNALLSGLDTDLTVLAGDGVSPLEFDDDDGEGSDSPLATYIRRSSSFSAAVAGTPLFDPGVHYLRVAAEAASSIARYRLHYGLQRAGRAPSAECEINADAGLADFSVKNYFAGAIDAAGDVDTYAFDALAGEWIFIALDGDPERDSGGDADDDPLALDGALAVTDPDGDVLISDHDDVNLASPAPDFPAEAMAFVAPLSGTYHVQVSGGNPLTDFGPGRTYELAIFRDNAAPAPAEDVDPAIDSVTPDFADDEVDVTASDDAPGDSGVCQVLLAPGSDNLQLLGLSFTPGDPAVAFSVGLIDSGLSGSGKLVIVDCAGNTACTAIDIDAGVPLCSGDVIVPGRRSFASTHLPLHAPDNQPAGPGVDGTITITENLTIADVNVTLSVESTRLPDVDVFLESPLGTRIDLMTDVGSVSAFDVTDATFDDSAAAPISILDDEPYTGTFKPDDLAGLAALNGQSTQGVWKLNVIDDSSSSTGGSRLVRWSLDIDAGFPNGEMLLGVASDAGGLASVALSGATNLQLQLPDDFAPGATDVEFTVSLINPALDGTGTMIVTDLSDNVCSQPINLARLTDAAAPDNSGAVTRDLVFGAEVQLEAAPVDPAGAVSTVVLAESVTIGEVVVEDLTINTLDVGRIAATLSRGPAYSALLNRVGMDERGSVGLTKDNLELSFDDDAPVADDAHEEPALGSIEFLGLHQPDGRGAVIGDGITADDRDHMLFAFEGLDSAGAWTLFVGDFREQISSLPRHEFRRWRARIISPGGPERYVGTARESGPQAGICSIDLAPGAVNLAVTAAFTAPAAEVAYSVSLVDPGLPGSGTLEIEDCVGNVTPVAVNLAAALPDQNLPVAGGAVNPATDQFEGSASDNQPGDSGIVAVELAPWSDNLQLVSVTPDPPGSAASVDFVVGLANPAANGRGYVRITDATGWRRHVLVDIDAQAPQCTGSVGRTKRYLNGPGLPAEIPDNSGAGVTSSINVSDFDLVSDVNVTFNVLHGFDDDVDLSFISPSVINLMSDIGLTGNDFIDTTLDDEAAAVIPDSSGAAPFTGTFKPVPPATLTPLDNRPAAGTYTLRVVDDKVFDRGTFLSWSLTIESPTFPRRFDGRTEDSGPHSAGICSIELLPGAHNVALTVDPFSAGDRIVRYSVALTDRGRSGSAVVRVTDCAGNTCETPVCLAGDQPPGTAGDVTGDGFVNLDDLLVVLGGFECTQVCAGDVDGDCDVDLDDLLVVLGNFE